MNLAVDIFWIVVRSVTAVTAWTFLLAGASVMGWATWQLAGYCKRQPFNGETYWGLVFYLHAVVPALGLVLAASGLFLLGRFL